MSERRTRFRESDYRRMAETFTMLHDGTNGAVAMRAALESVAEADLRELVELAYRAVEETQSLPAQSLTTDNNDHTIARARSVAWWLVKRLGHGPAHIGRVAVRDHSTVCKNLETLRKAMVLSDAVRAQVEAAAQRLSTMMLKASSRQERRAA